jgi:hypothetical protein
MKLEENVEKIVAAPETRRLRRFSFGKLLGLAAVAALSTVSIIYFLQQAADITGPVQMTIHGWIALAIGVIFSLVVGIGLMVLVFFSSRQGYDERVRDFDKD